VLTSRREKWTNWRESTVWPLRSLRLRELVTFSVQKMKLWGNLFNLDKYLKGGFEEDRSRLLLVLRDR